MEDKIYPSLRFRGFTDAWEQRKLGELGQVAMNKRIFKDQTNESGDVPFYKIGTFGSNPNAYITREIFEEYKFKYPYPELGDILISASGSIGRTVEYKGEDEYFQDSNIVWLKHNEEVQNIFLKHFYTIVKWNGLEGSTIQRLYNKNILETEIKLPIIEEQKKIGNFLNHLDSIITLHQHKYEKLVNIKKALLENMFPKNGEAIPKLRFKGFTDTWEQRELSEIATFSKGTGYSKSDLLVSGTPIILYGRLYTSYEVNISNVDTFVVKKDRSVISAGGEVIVPASGETAEDIAIASVVEKPGIILGGDLNIIHPNNIIDSTFLALSITYGSQHIDMAKRAQGKSVVHLHNSDLNKVMLCFPEKVEQLRISQHFMELDKLITLHQRKCDKLVNIKKALLQKMFV